MEPEKPIRVPHPSNDRSYVEFHGMSIRQKEILEDYKLYVSGRKARRGFNKYITTTKGNVLCL